MAELGTLSDKQQLWIRRYPPDLEPRKAKMNADDPELPYAKTIPVMTELEKYKFKLGFDVGQTVVSAPAQKTNPQSPARHIESVRNKAFRTFQVYSCALGGDKPEFFPHSQLIHNQCALTEPGNGALDMAVGFSDLS